MASRKTKSEPKTYQICWSHPEHGSDHIGCDFASMAAANAEILAIQKDAGRAGYVEWLQDACLWVTDGNGNLC